MAHSKRPPTEASPGLRLVDAARRPVDAVLAELAVSRAGLSGDEAAHRLVREGPNAVRTHRITVVEVLWRLLNNLLYDASQLTIPSDRVDEAQLRRPAHWDVAFIRRFMLTFGPLSSVFDFLTFAILLGVLHAAGPVEFRTGWFVESLATQTLIVFAIRTRRVPFWRSRPSGALVGSVLSVLAVGVSLPFTPVADMLGLSPLPWPYFVALVALVVAYLALIEGAKKWFYGTVSLPSASLARSRDHRVHRRASRFSTRQGV